MTRLAYGDAASDERPVYTTCDNCGRALCVECLERVADKLDTFADRAVAHDVLHAAENLSIHVYVKCEMPSHFTVNSR